MYVKQCTNLSTPAKPAAPVPGGVAADLEGAHQAADQHPRDTTHQQHTLQQGYAKDRTIFSVFFLNFILKYILDPAV